VGDVCVIHPAAVTYAAAVRPRFAATAQDSTEKLTEHQVSFAMHCALVGGGLRALKGLGRVTARVLCRRGVADWGAKPDSGFVHHGGA
jgi:hypothetical protein